MKHIIIGSGITGLYLAYKLINIKNINPNYIIIYEKDNRIGGRIYTYQNKIKDFFGAFKIFIPIPMLKN